MNDRASHRAAVEAGYADLAGYVAKYGNAPKYPGAAIRTARLVWPSTGEHGEVRLMDYGGDSKTRYRVAAFCPGHVVELPGDTPKVEPVTHRRSSRRRRIGARHSTRRMSGSSCTWIGNIATDGRTPPTGLVYTATAMLVRCPRRQKISGLCRTITVLRRVSNVVRAPRSTRLTP